MKKYKVLIVHNYYQVPGGEDTVVESEMKMLESYGHEVILYTRHNNEIKNMNKLSKVLSVFSNIFSFKTYFDVRKIIKDNGIDIVHVHNTFPLISPSVYYSAFSCKIPVVQTVHNFRLLCAGATFTRNNIICEECMNKGLKQALRYKCYRNSFLQTLMSVSILSMHRLLGTYRKVNAYIALTDFNKNKLQKLIKDENRIFVKPNFVRKKSEKVESDKYKDYFVYVGRLDKLKGINFLIDVWKGIKDTELYIIGDGPEKETILNLINDNKLSNVKMLGFMKREEAFKVVKEAIAVIVPSQWYEAFGLTAVEAFSLGVPVISSKIGSLEFIIKHDHNGLQFNYNSVEELSNNINTLLEDGSIRGRLSKEAYLTYKKEYTEDKNYNMLYKIYSEVINSTK